MPEYQKVSSSNIDALAWDAEVLFVKFKTGAIYKYLGVPKVIFTSVLEASSVGRAFAELVKSRSDQYLFERVS